MQSTTQRPASSNKIRGLSGPLRRSFKNHKPRVVLFFLIGAGLLVWEVFSRNEVFIDPLFVSYPSEIIASIPDLLGDERVRQALATSGGAMARAIMWGCLLGIVLGYLMGFFRILRDAFYSPALFLLSVPKSIFIPIFMIFFGINIGTAIYYGAFSSFIYVMVNVVGGLDLVREAHLRVARAYRASLHHRIIDVIFPASLPGVFTGIWYGIKNGLQGVLIFELFVTVGGLGQTITRYTNELRTDRVFALVVGISLLAILTGSAWSAAEKRLSRWRPQEGATKA